MLLFYLFLYVFSLTLPVFYHSAFFVGFVCLIHLLVTAEKISFKITKYQFNYLLFFIFGYVLIFSIIVSHETYDFTFFKTYSNSFLSAMCGMPLAYLYNKKYNSGAVRVLLKDLFYVFLIQSTIILLVMFFPVIKPMVVLFQRDPDYAAQLDVFSNGLRTNALSGGLFYGLSLSFGFALLGFIYASLYLKMRFTIIHCVSFIIVNIGLVCSGRFGFIYVICCLPMFYGLTLKRKINVFVVICFAASLSLVFVLLLYFFSDAIRSVVEQKISPYLFEFVKSYADTGQLQTSSTNQLMDMYDVNINFATALYGDGIYTGSDGMYYQHSDVGYIRLLLLGGIPLLCFFIIFQIYSLYPMRKLCGNNNGYLYHSVLLFFLLAQFKGEAMITSVGLNNMVFLLCSLISLAKRNYDESQDTALKLS
ncbi:hypothetical protein LVQ78_11730 [Buttiauxella sp. A2-C2_NF]|uniref:hypothetical protein n=1 Tax=Buttiauxella ferragutiae TaxID=82989 RepID=UPI001E5A801F|nr:hypothetical protein [Buttiauxella ferragutiae]MCE0826702.1 hypothetical protein [Buttiauxella ferragutiae]